MEQERNKRPSQHLLITMHSAGSRTGGGICYWCYIHQLGSNCTAQLTKSPIGYMKIHRISVNPSVLSCPEVLIFTKQTERKVTSLVLDNIHTKTNKMACTSSRHPCVNTPGVPSFTSLSLPMPWNHQMNTAPWDNHMDTVLWDQWMDTAQWDQWIDTYSAAGPTDYFSLELNARPPFHFPCSEQLGAYILYQKGQSAVYENKRDHLSLWMCCFWCSLFGF